MSKHGTFVDYPQRSLAAAEAALLTIWPTLNRYHEDLVLVWGTGGVFCWLAKRRVRSLAVPGGMPEASRPWDRLGSRAAKRHPGEARKEVRIPEGCQK